MRNADYQAYLSRFDGALGPLAVGAYGKWQGLLIQKLSAEQFAERYAEYVTLHDELERTVAAGLTLRNTLIKQLRELAANLVMPRPT